MTDALEQAFLSSLAPPARVSPLDWCERSIIIPAETGTPWPGPFNARATPWARWWYDVMTDPMTRLFAIQKGAQIAATQTTMNVLLYLTANDPGAVLYVMDSLDNARDTSKLRLQPIVEASPVLKAMIRDGSEDLENVLYQWRRCFWRLIGASSVGKASSFTHRIIALEEPEKYRDALGKEGNVIENLMQRVKRVWNSLVLINCTPSTKAGFIHKYVQLGDRNFCHVPCPHCGGMVVLRFSAEYGRETYPEGLPTAAVEYDRELSPVEAGRRAKLVCGLCKKAITDSQKRQIVDACEWRPTKKADISGYRSCAISGLYPKDEAASIRALVEKVLKARDNPTDLQVVVNSDFGELWELPPKKVIAKERIREIRDRMRYPRGTVPSADGVLLVMICDVQAHHVPFSVWAMDLGNLWLVDNGALSTVDDMDETFMATYYRAAWDQAAGRYTKTEEELRCVRLLSDARHRTTEVYNFCATHKYAVPIMGQSANARQNAPVRWRDTDKLPNGKPIVGNRAIKLAYLHPSEFKDQLAYAIDATLWPDDAPTAPPSKVKIWFHEDISEDFIHQMVGEVLAEGKENKFGQRDTYWKKVHTNDAFDLAQYAFAARHIGHNDLLRLRKKATQEEAQQAQEGQQREEGPQPKPNQEQQHRKRLAPFVDPNSVRL